MTAGADVASVLGGVLAELRDTDPPACGEPYPLAPEYRCTHPAGHEGLHGFDGPYRDKDTR